MPDLANVNISIQQFQAVATGKYNAGEVRLANETTLEKINNSVHFKGSNQTTLSHLEVLAIKNAFIKALSQNGVGVDEIARIRRDLGLAADTSAGADKKLSERSIKPLSRAQIRTILDRNAETINAHAGAGTIRTDAELHAGYSEARKASLAATREATNAGLAATRELDESHNIAIFQDLIAGNIYFREMEDTVRIIEYAKLQRDTILAKSGGHLRTEGRGVLQYQTRSNQSIDFELPTDEASYVRYLDETIVHLSSLSMQGANADSECGRVRREFASAPSKNSWIETHARSGESWKIRTAAVMLLEEAGIHDWATLSCVNRITDAEVKMLAKELVNLGGAVRGDALRQHVVLQALVRNGAAGANVPDTSATYIPAMSPSEWNTAVWDAIAIGKNSALPHEFKPIVDPVVGHLRELFGEDVIPAGIANGDIFRPADINSIIVRDNPAAQVTADGIRESFQRIAEDTGAKMCARKRLSAFLAATGAPEWAASTMLDDFAVSHPELLTRLTAARSAAETDAIIEESRDLIEAEARRFAEAERIKVKFTGFYKEALSHAMGVPGSALSTLGVDMYWIKAKGGKLADAIRQGTFAVASNADIEKAFRDLAADLAEQRVAAMRAVDELDIPLAVRDAFKDHLYHVGRVDNIDLARIVQSTRAAFGALADAIDAVLVPGADKNAVYTAMAPAKTIFRNVVYGLFPPGAEVGGDEMITHGRLVGMTFVFDKPGFVEKLEAFFERPDVAADMENVQDDTLPHNATIFQRALPEKTEKASLANAFGKSKMPPAYAFAVGEAFRDLGMDDLSLEAKEKLMTSANGRAIANKIRESAGPVLPSDLRSMVRQQFADIGANHACERFLTGLAAKNNIVIGAETASWCRSTLFGHNAAISEELTTAFRSAVVGRRDVRAAVAAVLEKYAEDALVVAKAYGSIEKADVEAPERALREIVERTGLDEAFVRSHLRTDAVAIHGGTLAFDRADLRDVLKNPATDYRTFNLELVAENANARVDSFISKKVAFLAQIDTLPVSDACKEQIRAATLSESTFKDAELPAATARILARADVANMLDFAKTNLVPEKIVGMSDKQVFMVINIVASTLNAAIEEELSEDKRASMDNGDYAVLTSLLNMAFTDVCGASLKEAAVQLAADGRFAGVDAAGAEEQERYNIEYVTYSTGIDQNKNRVPVDTQRALAANKSASNIALALRMLGTVRSDLYLEWLDRETASAVRENKATAEQRAIAEAALKRAPALFRKHSAGLTAEQSAELKAFLVTLDFRDAALAASEEALGRKAFEISLAGDGFDVPGSSAAGKALSRGYAPAELPMLQRVADIYREATGCTETEARIAALDQHSAARRLFAYGGRFTASAENFKAGLKLLGQFKTWLAARDAEVEPKRVPNGRVGAGVSLTALNADPSYFTSGAEYAYEKFIFEHIAIDESLPIATDDPNAVFDMEHNPVTRFFGRGYSTASTNTMAQIPPEKRTLVYEVFDLIAPLATTQAGVDANYHRSSNVEMIARILANLDAIAEMKEAGTLTKATFCERFLTDIPGAAEMTFSQIGQTLSGLQEQVLMNRLGGNVGKFFQFNLMMQSSGRTIEECAEAILNGQRLPRAPYIAPANGGISELDGTAKGGRAQCVLDLLRPASPVSISDGKEIFTDEQNVFKVNFPDGTTLTSSNQDQANAIADKIAELCGPVHLTQLSSVYFALTQAGENILLDAFRGQGYSTTEHTPLTYTLLKNEETGVITVRYSEPAGFPIKFSWECAIALDGTSTTTQMNVVAPTGAAV